MIMSPDLLFEFFNGVGVRNDCPACGRDRWVAHSNTEREGTGTVQMREDSPGIEAARPPLAFIYVVCDNCGLIRQHARPIIVRWAKGRDGADEAAEPSA
jgi:hypothetical protein